jgi:exonuclease SbcD
MKILHTADWHLGKWLGPFSRIEEQKEVLEEICHIAERESVDLVLVAGDLFDTFNPSTEAVELYFKTLHRLSAGGKRPVIAIAGNHDSAERIETPDPLALACGIVLVGYPDSVVKPFKLDTGFELLKSEHGFIEIKLPNSETPVRLLLTPYANEQRLKAYFGNEEKESDAQLRDLLEANWKKLADQYCDTKGINLLMAHLFFMKKGGQMPEESEDERSILQIGGAQAIYSSNVPSQIQYTALGHLHRYQVVDGLVSPIVYSSSPLAYSFGESNQAKYVVLVEAEAGKSVQTQKIELQSGKRLLRFRSESVEEAIKWLSDNQNAIVELTIVSESYLTATDRKLLLDAHPVVFILPEIKHQKAETHGAKMIDLSKEIEPLFVDYFTHAKGQAPNEDILALFREVLS